MTGTYAKSLLYRLSIKICIIIAFENLSGSTRFATSRLVTPAMGKRDGLSGRRKTGNESIRLKREISTIGINNTWIQYLQMKNVEIYIDKYIDMYSALTRIRVNACTLQGSQ